MYDVLVKRIHEYKRQHMNIFYVIHRYFEILNTPESQRAAKFVPRVVFIGGKAAPGYRDAKAFIKLINSVVERINNDKSINELLKVVSLRTAASPMLRSSSPQQICPSTSLLPALRPQAHHA